MITKIGIIKKTKRTIKIKIKMSSQWYNSAVDIKVYNFIFINPALKSLHIVLFM